LSVSFSQIWQFTVLKIPNMTRGLFPKNPWKSPALLSLTVPGAVRNVYLVFWQIHIHSFRKIYAKSLENYADFQENCDLTQKINSNFMSSIVWSWQVSKLSINFSNMAGFDCKLNEWPSIAVGIRSPQLVFKKLLGAKKQKLLLLKFQ